MKRKIEIDLPNHSRAYTEMEFVARLNDNYDPAKAAEGFAELLEYLNYQMPKVVVDRLVRDPRVINFRKMLEDKV